ncbi:MAG: hypothetical protein RL522_321 [Pseudomonadota bacterium]|jgi:uncharacterized protein (TIGR02284 family)
MAAEERDPNRDPLSDESGSHPVGIGVGAAGGAVAGAAAGMAGGPLGMAAGGVVGAVVGGLTGRAAAEAINPTAQESHWRDRYTQEPYYEPGRTFDDYGPAYRYGAESRGRYEDDWDTTSSELEVGWQDARGGSSLSWQQAQPASRAAWERVDILRGGTYPDTSQAMTSTSDAGTMGTSGVIAAAGEVQPPGDTTGSREDVVNVLQDLVECCKDGEYGFQSCAENAQREDLKAVFTQRMQDCQRGARELQEQILSLGGEAKDSGSALGAIHRGWVSVKTTLATYDDKATLQEAERGEDNALARYRKALQKPLPQSIRNLVERQFQGVQRHRDQIKLLHHQFGATS